MATQSTDTDRVHCSVERSEEEEEEEELPAKKKRGATTKAIEWVAFARALHVDALHSLPHIGLIIDLRLQRRIRKKTRRPRHSMRRRKSFYCLNNVAM